MNEANLMEVRGLSKAYRRYRSELQRVLGWFMSVSPLEETWVLRDVSFDLKHGEAVGIVGQNGAGKSTLLKMITGTQRPTCGDVVVSGRVAAILELGMGFNGDLTGRQNARHAAALFGMSPEEIDLIMPDVEAFAEIGDYFDQPMRVYSSGMQMRVAFAVATARRPDLLIVDEALSVGDAYFQHKSFDRIRQFQRQGSSLLIVSHDREAIMRLCDRVVLIDEGRMLSDGPPAQVMDYYNALIANRQGHDIEVQRLNDDVLQTSSGSGEARTLSVSLHDASSGRQLEDIAVGQEVELRLVIETHAALDELVVGYMIKDRLGQTIFGTNTWHTHQPLTDLSAGEKLDYRIRFTMNLGPGSYSLSTSLHSAATHLQNNYHWLDYALVFKVVNASEPFFIGTSWMPPRIECLRSASHACDEQDHGRDRTA